MKTVAFVFIDTMDDGNIGIRIGKEYIKDFDGNVVTFDSEEMAKLYIVEELVYG